MTSVPEVWVWLRSLPKSIFVKVVTGYGLSRAESPEKGALFWHLQDLCLEHHLGYTSKLPGSLEQQLRLHPQMTSWVLDRDTKEELMNSLRTALGFPETTGWDFKRNPISCIMKIWTRESEVWNVTINTILLVPQADETRGNFLINEKIIKYIRNHEL